MKKVRTRFSPSPTGLLHLGNVRTALFCALFAKKNDGVFILRIEDTDITRSEERYVTLIKEDLHWLGISWQEGPDVHGAFGPYWQSQRQPIYEKYYKLLEDKKRIYPCFCTDAELNLARKLQLSRGQAPRYSGTCRNLSAEEVAEKMAAGIKPAFRFIVPDDETIEYVDTVKGPQRFQSSDIGDFIIRRADGSPPFLFCNAIDDATMEVSHVLRGEDHVANTPRQIMILRALNLSVPQYGHLSLIVGHDGAPLSKRHGSFSLQEMQKQGFLPLALVNYLARLGHAFDILNLASLEELSAQFSLDKLSRSPARFDQAQLMYWQKLAVQALDQHSLWRWLGERTMHQVPEEARPFFADSIKANIMFPKDALAWANIFFTDHIEYSEDARSVIHAAGEQFFVEAEQAFDKYGLEIKPVVEEMKQTLHVSGKKLFMPLRFALTGLPHGPELDPILKLLGHKRLKHRLNNAFKYAIGNNKC